MGLHSERCVDSCLTQARDTIATPGTRYAGLYQQAIREFQWFEGSDFRDLARSGKASCNALVDRICDAVWLCMADSWAPVALFHLNHEIQHLQYRMALLGPPTASAKGLQQSRRHAGEVAAGRLVDAEIRLMDLYCDQMLMGLEQAVLELVPSELVVLPWELGDRWFGLKEQVMEVCSKSLRAATTFWVRELRSELLRGGGIPPWPSPEALDMISLELPAMSPVVWRARHLLESWLQEITEKEHSLAMADIQACLDLFFDRAQRHPGVRISPLLGASPKAVRLEADSRALADSLVVVFLASASDLVRHRVAGALPGMVEAASSSSEPAEIRADMEEQALRLRKSVVMVEELLQHGGESVLSEELRKVSVCRCTVEAEEIASFGGVRVIVTARDSLGGLLCGGDLPFRIRWQVEASRVVVANLKYIGRGLYAADFDPSAVSRLLTGTVIHVELYGTELPGSPFVMDFLATQWIQCSGSGLEFAMPGRAQHFTICARDGGNGGELRLHGGLKFSVLSQKRSRIPVRIEYSQSEGTYGVTYEVPPPSKAQPYALSLNVELKGGTAVLGSPFLVPFILPSIQVDFPLQHLSGCRLHYDEPYSAAASELDFPSAADGCWVFVCEVNTASNPGCAAIGAFGKLGEVFVDRATHSGSSLYEHNGLFWYWRPGKAFGFASSQDADLAAPQIAPHSLPPRRDQLSWALSSWSGGDRARDNALVSDSLSSWRKRIYLIGKKKRSPRQRVTSISVLPSICE